jgi:Uma2 family endonuclease
MSVDRRWKSSDLDVLPDDGRRYEIIDGALHVSELPRWNHQYVCGNVLALLGRWSAGRGVANQAPGLIFAEDDDVAPDVVWVSCQRLPQVLRADGKLHAAPELIVEVLSPGGANERRDREVKPTL